ncbi:MAG: polyphenol oxidase family protein [Solirubrobacteraceae bacterium]
MLSAPFYESDGQILIELPGARAVFTTSRWGDVRRTRAEIEGRLGVRSVFATQVHGNTVVVSDAAAAGGQVSDGADAILTTTPGIAPSVHTADCLPIALSAPGVVAAVHAGWRGLDTGVIDAAVRAVREASDVDAELTAAIGPGAGVCCYQVGPELRTRFPQYSHGQNLDLKAIAADQLRGAGVTTIYDCEICTICSTVPKLFSYRRDGEHTGRQMLLTWLI